ncbi:putative acetyltransferase [Rhodopirellula rubra]|uniref:Putative acetyltransferase n=1 Tax=Aporhodopirellula rubra TaxID=980271 RepID=A0A7W5DWF5_9BACT|nr:GNAT family N-acetyltransferase [Aporhodopirellula rubra]MBB3205799.1 putative acetyltransferase [Aporhodopirellula rubra]
MMIRTFTPHDAAECLALFRHTIREINRRDYSPAQINAWASDDISLDAWAKRFEGRIAYVATHAGAIVGFTDMTEAGNLDRLFVSADFQRQGIARQLVLKLIENATEWDCDGITTEASITAKPFFESMGFTVIQEQSVQCRGIALTNFEMRLPIG